MESQNDYDTRKERSQYLFSILSRAVAYDESGPDSAPLFETGLEGYQLREGAEVMEYTTTGNIWDWLRDSNRSTFLFPDNNAHPDLMFILERRRGNSNTGYGLGIDTVICALQVSSQKNEAYVSITNFPRSQSLAKYTVTVLRFPIFVQIIGTRPRNR